MLVQRTTLCLNNTDLNKVSLRTTTFFQIHINSGRPCPNSLHDFHYKRLARPFLVFDCRLYPLGSIASSFFSYIATLSNREQVPQSIKVGCDIADPDEIIYLCLGSLLAIFIDKIFD